MTVYASVPWVMLKQRERDTDGVFTTSGCSAAVFTAALPVFPCTWLEISLFYLEFPYFLLLGIKIIENTE